jgi:hypothetical protein
MVQIIDEYRQPSTSDRFSEAFSNLGDVLGQAIPQHLIGQKQNRAISNLLGEEYADLPRDFQQKAFEYGLDAQNKRAVEAEKLKSGRNQLRKIEQQYGLEEGDLEGFENNPELAQRLAKSTEKGNFIDRLRGNDNRSIGNVINQESSQQEDGTGWYDQLSDSDRQEFSFIYPQEGKALEANRQNKIARENAENKRKRAEFESERSYHSGYSKDAEKEANNLRQSIPKKEMALDFARNSIESGDIDYFSPNKLADATGIDLFRTAKGAQLVTAGKENLLSNMSRVGAKAQNIWFEQRLNSMFPKIGQSKEANLTVQEMLEGEMAIDEAFLKEFDRLSSEDEEKYGFVKKDISKRVQNNLRSSEKEILKRTTYRMKEIEEQEKGLNQLKKQVGKNVSKGTPFTLEMAKLYKEKFGDNALDVADKNGYYIPTVEEFRVFESTPQEFRENIR